MEDLIELLTYHRRGQWFKSSTAHHISGLHNALQVIELLISSMDPDYKRRLELRQMSNHELFQRYDNELVLRLHSAKNLRDTRNKLSEFREYLNDRPPSPDLAKAFLTRYADRKPRTRYRYTQMIKAFMLVVMWYRLVMSLKRLLPVKKLPSLLDGTLKRLT